MLVYQKFIRAIYLCGNNKEEKKIDYKSGYALGVWVYTKRCDLNNGRACSNLGDLYAKGQGVKQDYQQAIEYYTKGFDLLKKACDLKEQKGCDGYAILNKASH